MIMSDHSSESEESIDNISMAGSENFEEELEDDGAGGNVGGGAQGAARGGLRQLKD